MGRKRPQAARKAGGPSLKHPYGRFRARGGPTAGLRRVWHGGPKWNFKESMATPCPTPITMSFIVDITLQQKSLFSIKIHGL
jgi:hypothetical protein